MNYNASILAIGCSSEYPYHIPCIEYDSQWVSRQHELAHDRFPNEISYPKYPVHKWHCQEWHGESISPADFKKLILAMPVMRDMRLMLSMHGFLQKIKKGKRKRIGYFLWLGNKYCYMEFRELVKFLNDFCEQHNDLENFSIWLDTCFSGSAKKDINAVRLLNKRLSLNARVNKQYLKNYLEKKSKYIEPFGKVDFVKDQLLKGVKVHKKIGIWVACRAKQTSFANFSPNDYFPVTTNGVSLGISGMVTSLNKHWAYAPGLNIKVKGKIYKPRDEKAVLIEANRRVLCTIYKLGTAEWLDWADRTPRQHTSKQGHVLYY